MIGRLIQTRTFWVLATFALVFGSFNMWHFSVGEYGWNHIGVKMLLPVFGQGQFGDWLVDLALPGLVLVLIFLAWYFAVKNARERMGTVIFYGVLFGCGMMVLVGGGFLQRYGYIDVSTTTIVVACQMIIALSISAGFVFAKFQQKAAGVVAVATPHRDHGGQDQGHHQAADHSGAAVGHHGG